MAIRIKWDKYETALLIDLFWRINAHPEQRGELISNLSQVLRKNAINNGYIIDDKYRNITGITMQLSSIEHAFYPERPGLKSTVGFDAMVRMYKEDREEFNKILEEANNMINKMDAGKMEIRDNKVLFTEWLVNKGKQTKEITDIIMTFEKASIYANNRKMIQSPLWELETADAFTDITEKLLKSNYFRLVRRSLALALQKAVPLYEEFLKEYRKENTNGIQKGELEKDKVESKDAEIAKTEHANIEKEPLKTESVDELSCVIIESKQKESDTSERDIQAPETQTDNHDNDKIEKDNLIQNNIDSNLLQDVDFLPDRVFAALKEESERNSYGTTAAYIASQLKTSEKTVKYILMRADWAVFKYGKYTCVEEDSGIKEFHFERPASLSFTQPVSLTYYGRPVSKANTWRGLYLDFLRTLYEDFPERIKERSDKIIGREALPMIRTDVTKGKSATLAEFEPGLFVEMNLPGDTIAENIKNLLDYCNIHFNNVILHYRRKKIHDIRDEDSRTELATSINKGGEERIDAASADSGTSVTFMEADQMASDSEKWKEVNSTEENQETKTDFKKQHRNRERRYYKEEKEEYYVWLQENYTLDKKLAGSYIRNVQVAEDYAKDHISEHCGLFVPDSEIIKFTLKALNSDRQFQTNVTNNKPLMLMALRTFQHFHGIVETDNSGKIGLSDNERKNPADTSSRDMRERTVDFTTQMTITEAIVDALQASDQPLTAIDILNLIEKRRTYQFKNEYPLTTVFQELRRCARNISTPNHNPIDLFESIPEDESIKWTLIHEGKKEDTSTESERGKRTITELASEKTNTSSKTSSKEQDKVKTYQRLYRISRVNDYPAGVTLDNLMKMLGDEIDPEQVRSILNNAKWAFRIKDDLYTFSAKAAAKEAMSEGAETTEKKEIAERIIEKEKYINTLMRRFRNGMTFDSIDYDIFRNTYEMLYDETINVDDETLREQLRTCGVMYKGRLFPAEGVIDNQTREILFRYIDDSFAEGKKVIYYKALFADLSDLFRNCYTLADDEMLQAYLEFTADPGNYYFWKNYMSKDRQVVIDHNAEVEDFLLSEGKPMRVNDICAALSHIPQDQVERIIITDDRFLRNAKGEYFHTDIFEISDEELEKIAGIINGFIAEDEYAIWTDVWNSIKEKMPLFVENNQYLSGLGIRNAIAKHYKGRFAFNAAVISLPKDSYEMKEVYLLFAKHHSTYSAEDVNTLTKELDTVPYFESLYRESVRVSHDLFISKKLISFDVEKVDKAIASYMSKDYIRIREVDSFLAFPNVGYEWNEYLLESYLLSYSRQFSLLNNGLAMNNVAGAIVKRDGRIKEFVDVCAEILADEDVVLKKKEALKYLAENDLITRQSYRNIDLALQKASRLKMGRR